MPEYKTLDEEIMELFTKRNIVVKLTVSFKTGKGVWTVEEISRGKKQ